jgi:hypothetical protein
MQREGRLKWRDGLNVRMVYALIEDRFSLGGNVGFVYDLRLHDLRVGMDQEVERPDGFPLLKNLATDVFDPPLRIAMRGVFERQG